MFDSPRSIEAEQGVIGSLFLKNELIADAVSQLTVEHFFDIQHQAIFKAMVFASESGFACDAMTIADVLNNSSELDKAGGMAYIAEIIHNTASAINFKSYVKLIVQKFKERQVLIASQLMVDEIHSDEQDSELKINNALSHVTGLDFTSTEERTFDSVMINVLNDIEARCTKKGSVGVSTGFKDLDERTSGLNKTDLIILAARPAMGKTTLAMNIAQHTLNEKNGCTLVFSMEMSSEQLMMRMLASRGKVFLNRLMKGELEQDDWPKLTAATKFCKDHPIIIDDRPALTPQQVRARALREKRKHGEINLIVIDYLQLMRTNKSENRTSEVSEISRSLKGLAKELNCPVIALSQLNRAVEQRADRRPVMADLRDSGAIEQDADIIWFLYRDDVYNENSDFKGMAELITAKFRNGETGKDFLRSDLHFAKFSDFTGHRPSEDELTPKAKPKESPSDAWERKKKARR